MLGENEVKNSSRGVNDGFDCVIVQTGYLSSRFLFLAAVTAKGSNAPRRPTLKPLRVPQKVSITEDNEPKLSCTNIKLYTL